MLSNGRLGAFLMLAEMLPEHFFDSQSEAMRKVPPHPVRFPLARLVVHSHYFAPLSSMTSPPLCLFSLPLPWSSIHTSPHHLAQLCTRRRLPVLPAPNKLITTSRHPRAPFPRPPALLPSCEASQADGSKLKQAGIRVNRVSPFPDTSPEVGQ